MSEVIKIGIAKSKNGEIQEVKEINVSAGKGIIGDRYFNEKNEDRNQLTLIESENIDYYNNKFNLKIPYLNFRRNIVTKGIKLNDLVGKKLADRLNLKLKSKVVITFQDQNYELTSLLYRVEGIFRSGNSRYDETNVFVKH